MSEHKHASVILHVSHPAGISEEAEREIAHATARHIEHLESHGFVVHYAHHHTHGGHTVPHRDRAHHEAHKRLVTAPVRPTL